MILPNELNNWIYEKAQHNWAGIFESRTVSHQWKKCTGGRIMFAGLTLQVFPNKGFELIIDGHDVDESYINAIKNGIFSVLLSISYSPVLNVKIKISDIDAHEINSSYAAFYKTAEEAIKITLGQNENDESNIKW